MLEPDYVPADLIKVPNDPRKGGIWHKDAGSDLDGKLQGEPKISELLLNPLISIQRSGKTIIIM